MPKCRKEIQGKTLVKHTKKVLRHMRRNQQTQYRQPKFRMSKVFVVITMACIAYIGIANNIPYHTIVCSTTWHASRSISMFHLQKSYIWLNIHRNHAQYTHTHNLIWCLAHRVLLLLLLLLFILSYSFVYFTILTLLSLYSFS